MQARAHETQSVRLQESTFLPAVPALDDVKLLQDLVAKRLSEHTSSATVHI
jgi:hypothetical protein